MNSLQYSTFTRAFYLMTPDGQNVRLGEEDQNILLSEGVEGFKKLMPGLITPNEAKLAPAKISVSEEVTVEAKVAKENKMKSEHSLEKSLQIATELLKQQPQATILLRFSPSQNAYILVSDKGGKEEKLTNEQLDVLLSQGIDKLKELVPGLMTPKEAILAKKVKQTKNETKE